MWERNDRKGEYGKKIAVFAVVALLGLALLVISGMIGKEEDAGKETKQEQPSPEEYANTVSEQVESICKDATGYEARAVVSLEGGYRAVYAEDSNTGSGGYKSSMVLVGSGKEESAVLVCYENPRISGIGVVLSCKEDPQIRNKIVSLVSAAFSLKTNKIYVAFSG